MIPLEIKVIILAGLFAILLEAYQSRKAYFKPEHKTSYGYSDKLLEYFCTTGCAFQWLRDNLSNIIERQHAPKKIIERIIRQSENN